MKRSITAKTLRMIKTVILCVTLPLIIMVS